MGFISGIFSYILAFFLAIIPATTYTEGVIGQPHSFLPHQLGNQNDRAISKLIYRGLFKYDIYGVLVPDLADTWAVSEDGIVYTVKLKPNQHWSNGRKITSDDLLYTAYKNPDLIGVGTDRVDELTVRYILPNKYSPFLSLLTLGVMPMDAEKASPLHPVSSGDFTVGRVEKNGAVIRQVILVGKNKNFDIKKLSFRYYSNEDELESAARLGEIDGFVAEQAHEIRNFEDRKFPVQGIYYSLFFNLRNKEYQDVALRQKLEMVLPVEKIIVEKGIMAQGPISRSLFTDAGIEFNKYNKDYKEDLKGLELTITIPDTKEHEEFVQEIKRFWEDKLNVKVNIKTVSPEKMLSQVIEPRDFEILFYGQEVSRDPDRYVNWHSAQSNIPGFNLSGFDQIRSDRALEEGRSEIDSEKRVLHYNEFQKVVVRDVPAIFLYHPYVHYYVSKYISGVGGKYTFTYSDRFLDFFNWRRVRTN